MTKYANPAHVVLDPGKNFTGTFAAACQSGRFVSFAAGGRPGAPGLARATATSPVIGVSKYDVGAGETGGVFAGSGGQIAVVAGAAITAPVGVVSDAEGRAVPAGAGVAPVAVAYTDGVLNDSVYIQLV